MTQHDSKKTAALSVVAQREPHPVGPSHRVLEKPSSAISPPTLLVKATLFLCWIVGSLPVSLRQKLGQLLGRMVALGLFSERKFATAQIRKFLPGVNPNHTFNAMCGSLAQTALESLNLSPLIADKFISVDNPELFSQLKEHPGSILALTAHTSNWELLAGYAAKQGFTISAVGRMARRSVLQPVLSSIRLNNGVTTIWRAGKGTLRQLMALFSTRSVIAALVDQDTRVASELIPFFGAPARTPSNLVQLAIRYQAKIVAIFIFRERPDHFRIFLHELDNSTGTTAVLTEYNRLLEHYIREYPEQWVWFHKRWRVDQFGNRRSSSEYLKWLEQAD